MHEPGCSFSAHTTSLQTHLAHAVLLSTPKNVQQMSKRAEKHAGPREHVGVGCAALLRPTGHASGIQGLPAAWIWLPSSLPDTGHRREVGHDLG